MVPVDVQQVIIIPIFLAENRFIIVTMVNVRVARGLVRRVLGWCLMINVRCAMAWDTVPPAMELVNAQPVVVPEK